MATQERAYIIHRKAWEAVSVFAKSYLSTKEDRRAEERLRIQGPIQ